MFRSALFKLTAFYFALLLFVCLTFSIPAYSIASQRISRGADNQTQIFRRYENFPQPGENGGPVQFDPDGTIRNKINNQINADRQELFRAIALINIAILSLGTVLCYLFAKRTLRPIEKLHRAQSRFTADASHELRTPLTVMKTEIEVALLQKLTAPKLRDVLTSNLEEIDRLSALSDQLLALTHIEDETEERHTIDLSELIVREIESLEKQYSISIDQHVDKKIEIVGIEPLCKDLLNILVANAVQYAGDKPPEITVTLSKNGEKDPELTVRDHGLGIESNDLPHIFERFYRGSLASKNRTSGHGLGLSLASEIVHRHDGRISVMSTPGENTEFHIIF